ncbi:RcpC/CpaB family pilus assembly protein [Streptomyces sp. NPDC021356]|uniref:RcpC/CpaB family pilus assembly protein n=1 Tax=Streptomyces sp. NPDC021356 TaxID=3154900 RepID=UPI00341048C8
MSLSSPSPAADRLFPGPLATETPAPCEVPHFAPVRVRGGRYLLRRLLRHRGRAVVAGLAVTAAALVAAGPRPTQDAPRGAPARGHPGPAAGTAAASRDARASDADRTVTVPVRIADAATVRLLRPGDRVDVIAVTDQAADGRARVVARGARVKKVPEPLGSSGAAAHTGSGRDTVVAPDVAPAAGSDMDDALVTLAVPRSAGAELAGASATARLAVTLW